MKNFANLSCSTTYTPEQIYRDVLAFVKDRTLEDLIPEDQVVIAFRPVCKGEWHLRTFGVPGIAEIDIDEPRLILADKWKPQTAALLPGFARWFLLELLAEGHSLQDVMGRTRGFTRDEAVAYLKALAAKEAQCTK